MWFYFFHPLFFYFIFFGNFRWVWTCQSLHQAPPACSLTHWAFLSFLFFSKSLLFLFFYTVGGSCVWGGGSHDDSMHREAAAGRLQRALQGVHQVRSRWKFEQLVQCWGLFSLFMQITIMCNIFHINLY